MRANSCNGCRQRFHDSFPPSSWKSSNSCAAVFIAMLCALFTLCPQCRKHRQPYLISSFCASSVQPGSEQIFRLLLVVVFSASFALFAAWPFLLPFRLIMSLLCVELDSAMGHGLDAGRHRPDRGVSDVDDACGSVSGHRSPPALRVGVLPLLDSIPVLCRRAVAMPASARPQPAASVASCR
jgi:hypothetical protein